MLGMVETADLMTVWKIRSFYPEAMNKGAYADAVAILCHV